MRTPHAVIVARAAAFRAALTTTEALLWEELRAEKLGVRFRRQVVLGRYIADFVAPRAKLVVEVDGEVHEGRAAADARRDGTSVAWATACCGSRASWCRSGSRKQWR
jgi:very-short-patch-repair endonuclease